VKHLTFYLDFISPYAYLAFEALPEALMGHSYSVGYKPVVFGALLKHHGQLGPAEIPGKRAWTYRQVLWLARQHSVDLHMPATHPFASLALLRLAVACGGAQGDANRYVCETIFRHVWQGGHDAADAQRLQALTTQLAPALAPDSEAVKTALRANTDAALAQGVFGVPTMEVDGHLFWGLDALPMLQAYLAGDSWFASAWDAAEAVPTGVTRL
jgi:2-hydroxychromene-2-carboxylate isomerase